MCKYYFLKIISIMDLNVVVIFTEWIFVSVCYYREQCPSILFPQGVLKVQDFSDISDA